MNAMAIEIKLRQKHTAPKKGKSFTKKKSNSGGVGRKFRAAQRHITPDITPKQLRQLEDEAKRERESRNVGVLVPNRR